MFFFLLSYLNRKNKSANAVVSVAVFVLTLPTSDKLLVARSILLDYAAGRRLSYEKRNPLKTGQNARQFLVYSGDRRGFASGNLNEGHPRRVSPESVRASVFLPGFLDCERRVP